MSISPQASSSNFFFSSAWIWASVRIMPSSATLASERFQPRLDADLAMGRVFDGVGDNRFFRFKIDPVHEDWEPGASSPAAPRHRLPRDLRVSQSGSPGVRYRPKWWMIARRTMPSLFSTLYGHGLRGFPGPQRPSPERFT